MRLNDHGSEPRGNRAARPQPGRPAATADTGFFAGQMVVRTDTENDESRTASSVILPMKLRRVMSS